MMSTILFGNQPIYAPGTILRVKQVASAEPASYMCVTETLPDQTILGTPLVGINTNDGYTQVSVASTAPTISRQI